LRLQGQMQAKLKEDGEGEGGWLGVPK